MWYTKHGPALYNVILIHRVYRWSQIPAGMVSHSIKKSICLSTHSSDCFTQNVHAYLDEVTKKRKRNIKHVSLNYFRSCYQVYIDQSVMDSWGTQVPVCCAIISTLSVHHISKRTKLHAFLLTVWQGSISRMLWIAGIHAKTITFAFLYI